MKDIKILVVDDTDTTRTEFVQGLKDYGFNDVYDVESGDDAIKMVELYPQKFQIAVVDHKLDKGTIDGIKTVEKICAIDREIFCIIFTNVPSSNPETTKLFRMKSYEAGAYRYLYRADQKDKTKEVSDFVKQINQLRLLQNEADSIYEKLFPQLSEPFMDPISSD